jgi:hypothetical protein
VLPALVAAVLFGLMLAGPMLLIATIVVALAAAVVLVLLAGAIVATPYLLVRHVHGRLVERHRVPRAEPVATPEMAPQPPIGVLAA